MEVPSAPGQEGVDLVLSPELVLFSYLGTTNREVLISEFQVLLSLPSGQLHLTP